MSLFTLLTTLTLLLPVKAYYRGGPIYGDNFGIPGRNASYDYVVVGGGTAGLAMAMRLAENPANMVAVIEAGGFYEEDMGNTSVVPNLGLVYDTGITLLTKAFPTIDWGIQTTPQTGLMNQSYHYWRGKTLGGR
jgi:choline dehydrogenase